MKKKKTVTLPRTFNPGDGHPKETLAYLSPAEHDLIRRLTDGKAELGPKGVKSYADDSASSNGVSRGDGNGTRGSGGLGQGGQGSNRGSSASRSPSGGVSTGGGMRGAGSNTGPGSGRPGGSGGQSVNRGAGGQRGAGSNYGPGGGAFGGVSKAAQDNAVRGSGTASQWGGRSFSSPLTAGNGSYYGPKGGNALNTDARMAAARSVGFSQPAISRTPGDAEMLGRMMMAESGSIRNRFGNVNTAGLQGVGDVVRNRMLSDRFPDTVPGVLTQRKQFSPIQDGSFARTPANPTATRIAESILSGESPPVVGNALNYGNLHTINNLDGYSSAATRRSFNAMTPTAVIADARNPNSLSHTFGTLGNNSDVAFNKPGSYSPGISGGTQVAGLAGAGIGQADALERARKASQAASALQGLGSLGPMQGPNMPPQGIPQPASIGLMPSQYSGYGTFDAPAQAPRQAQAPVSVFSDPRVASTPLGSLPAAKPPKEVQLAWNVPPMGGSVPSQYGDLFGVWGSNRPLPKGPAATPGTIHSQTASTSDSAPSLWEKGAGWIKANTGVDVDQKIADAKQAVDDVKQTKGWQFAKDYPALAALGLRLWGAPGGNMGGSLGNPQDRSFRRPTMPLPVQQQPVVEQAQASPLQTLQNLMANMVAKGAPADQIAYVQDLINQLSNSKVA